MRKVTIYSIAQELGVSASTVSRAFTRPELVKASVREQVLRKADELGYAPNRAARGLATGRSGLIGLLIPDITNPFFPPLVRAIQRAANNGDAEVMLVDASRGLGKEENLVRKLRPYVDGLIVASPRLPDEALRSAVEGIPAVFINRQLEGFPSVLCDNSQPLQAAAEHLRSLGHERYALMKGPRNSWAAGQRASAVRSWARAQGVSLSELGPFEAQFEDGRTAAAHVLRSGATAVFAFDDLMAAGVIAGLSELGQRVPGDRSIVGCDDVLIARTMTPSLSTVSAPMQALGDEAVHLLELLLTDQPVSSVVLEGELMLRATTAGLNGTLELKGESS